jgi:hypothetical protein
MGAVMPQMDQILSGSREFQGPILARSLGQLATSFGGFFATCTAMYMCLAVSVWITLPMSALAAGFLVRIFIIQHDCGHGSFFKSRRANELIGRLCSLMTLTPYAFWRRQHARHYGSWNNLDRRAASGLDIYSSCMTVAEYRALGRWHRGLVRLTNHPIVANLLLPPLVFIILYRVPFEAAKRWQRERVMRLDLDRAVGINCPLRNLCKAVWPTIVLQCSMLSPHSDNRDNLAKSSSTFAISSRRRGFRASGVAAKSWIRYCAFTAASDQLADGAAMAWRSNSSWRLCSAA